MFDFGDDLVIDSYRIPWLIWIQILVMFLLTLFIVLSYFGFLSVESDGDTLVSSSSPHPLDPPSACSHGTQVAANHDAGEEIATSNTIRGLENSSETDRSSAKDLALPETSVRFFHPCRYLDLAKQAFLKCLGLGSASPECPAREREHED